MALLVFLRANCLWFVRGDGVRFPPGPDALPFSRGSHLQVLDMVLLRKNRIGLTVGVFLGIWHSLWALLVWLGWGQRLVDFILWAHMIHVAYIVGPLRDLKGRQLLTTSAKGQYSINHLGLAEVDKLPASS